MATRDHPRRRQNRPSRCSLAAGGSAAADFGADVAADDLAERHPAAGDLPAIGLAADEPGGLLANVLRERGPLVSDPAGCARDCLLRAAALADDCCAGGRRAAAALAAAERRDERRRDRRSDRDRGLRANRSPAVRGPCVAAAEAFGAAGDLARADVDRRTARPTMRGRREEVMRRRGGDRGRGLHDAACAAGDHQMNCSGLAARVRWLSMQIYGERGVRRGGACSETSPTRCCVDLRRGGSIECAHRRGRRLPTQIFHQRDARNNSPNPIRDGRFRQIDGRRRRAGRGPREKGRAEFAPRRKAAKREMSRSFAATVADFATSRLGARSGRIRVGLAPARPALRLPH